MMKKAVKKVYGKDKKLLKIVYNDGSVWENQAVVKDNNKVVDSNKPCKLIDIPKEVEQHCKEDFLTAIVKERTMTRLEEEGKDILKNIFRKIKKFFNK